MVKFATRMNNLKGSAIRELLALANKPEILSFAGGMPAPELFPVDKMKAATDAVLDEMGEVALQYTSTDGWPRLREQIAERMGRKNGIKTTAANILMTSGSQQGLDYSARVFVDPGDVVIIESPSYLGALNANEKRLFTVPLAFAGKGGLKVRLFRDTDSDNTKPCADVTCDTFLCDASDSLTASATANGGFAAIVEPADAAAPAVAGWRVTR